jgi:putative membrane protein
MTAIADGLVALVALEHVSFLVLEMFLWTKPIGQRTFRQSQEQAKASAALAANQGLYNGFLAAVLGWGLVAGSFPVKAFFLACVVVAGFGVTCPDAFSRSKRCLPPWP